MSSDEEYFLDESDSGNVSPEPEDDEDEQDFGMDIGLGEEPGPSRIEQSSESEYPHEVLSTEQIVQHMVESIKEVNSVIQVLKNTPSLQRGSAHWNFSLFTPRIRLKINLYSLYYTFLSFRSAVRP
jgi:ariadne-1